MWLIVSSERVRADVCEHVDQVHEVALALAGDQLHEPVAVHLPGRDPLVHLQVRAGEAEDVCTDVDEVLRVIVAEVEVLAPVDDKPMVDLLARSEMKKTPSGSFSER
jgi:hypothetical protein